MNIDQNQTYKMLEEHFRKLRQPKCTRIIERLLPAGAVMFLFDHSKILRIDMLVEKRSKDDYVMIEIEENNQRVYVFQLLLDELRSRFAYSASGIFQNTFKDRHIADLMVKLKAL